MKENQNNQPENIEYNINPKMYEHKARKAKTAGPYFSITARGWPGILVLIGMIAGTAIWGVAIYKIIPWIAWIVNS